jgi:hypothetical protein
MLLEPKFALNLFACSSFFAYRYSWFSKSPKSMIMTTNGQTIDKKIEPK